MKKSSDTMKNEDNKNDIQESENSKYDNVLTVAVVGLYILGLVMFARYMVKSVSEIVKRNQEKNVKEQPVNPKNAQIKTIMYSKAIAEFQRSK